MASFDFVTIWKVDAPIEVVWKAMYNVEEWPSWWKGVEIVEVIAPGDANRIGRITRNVWKSALPYRLRFDARVVRIEPMSLIEVRYSGELEGSGVMHFSHDGRRTAFRHNWRVSTTKPWMNFLAPIARPFFSWNHKVLMDWGAEGLSKKLGVSKIETFDS